MAEAWTRLLSRDLPRRQSAFPWGARNTGKSTLLWTTFPQSLAYDLLKTDLALSFGDRQALLREQLLARSAAELDRPIILDKDAKTVKEYFQIPCDTLLGRLVPPYMKQQERQVISKALEFYFFDVGVAGALTKRHLAEQRGEQFGRALEHLVFMELAAHASYRELGYDISFWRTKAGAEVDFVLGQGEVAIEVKGISRVDDRDLRSLALFRETHRPRLAVVVSNEPEERFVAGVRILPWRLFFEELWNGRIMGG